MITSYDYRFVYSKKMPSNVTSAGTSGRLIQRNRLRIGTTTDMYTHASQILDHPDSRRFKARKAVNNFFCTDVASRAGLCKDPSSGQYFEILYDLAVEIGIPVPQSKEITKTELCALLCEYAREVPIPNLSALLKSEGKDWILRPMVPISAGASHSLALSESGQIIAWGDNRYGQTGVPEMSWTINDCQPKGERFIAISAGTYHSLGLLESGQIIAWGNNEQGQTKVPEVSRTIVDCQPKGERFIAISAGGYHSLGLLGNGKIIAWGNNDCGQTQVSRTINDCQPKGERFTAISAGRYHSLGLLENGQIIAWGDNNWGQTQVPEVTERFTAISAGAFHSLGLLESGQIIGWGDNYYGQTKVPEKSLIV